MGKEDKKYIRHVVGSFLYYARAADLTILTALSDIASEQSKPTEKTMKRVKQFLDYMHTNPVGTLANGYIKSAPLPRVTARAAHVTAVTDR